MSITNVNLTSKSTDAITLTDAAVSKVAELIGAAGADEPLALRVAVKSGGCSGFNYDMYFDSEVADDDVVSTFGEVRVVVDPASAELLSGASLDFSDGLQGAGFHITGEFIEVAPFNRIVHVERMHLPDPTPDNHIVTTFMEDGSGTLMTMRMTLPDEKTRATMLGTGMEHGMEDSYTRLETLL